MHKSFGVRLFGYDIRDHVKHASLWPFIGKRFWEGVLGIMDHGQLIADGTVHVRLFGTRPVDRNWILEGIGVKSDNIVETIPSRSSPDGIRSSSGLSTRGCE